MNTRDTDQVDQALFGYSDGHRQIAASLRLSSKDLYNLAAASDLASGAKLGPDDSYLTGLPLTESRHYALIRTWAAPEMPRPGCVWSHVLLIDFRLLSSHGDLSEFLGLLRRPVEPSPKLYGEPISIEFSDALRAVPDRRSVIELIRSYYSGSPVLLDEEVERTTLEAAITAVWSQQWPRLRTSFSFRTAAGGERRKSELIDYDVQTGAGGSSPAEHADASGWVAAGAADAELNRVTPLRRFLWRYGRDLSAPRKHYRTLVELFLETENRSELSSDKAIQIFDAMPEQGDGEILKRDILGIGSASPSLCPPVPLSGLLQLLTSDHLGMVPTEDELRRRFGAAAPDQVGTLAHYADRHGAALSRWQSVIEASLIVSADRNALAGEFPERFRRLILMSRPDLIDHHTVAPLSNDDLLELVSRHATDEIGRTLAHEIVRRDFGTSNARLFRSRPIDIFEAAVAAARSHELASAWVNVIGDSASAILETSWPVGVTTTMDFANGLSLLRFPKSAGRTTDAWADALSSMRDDVTGDDRVRLHAFLLRAALQSKTQATWTLAAAVLPELRPVILQGDLPNDVYQMLVNDLPKYGLASNWDIDKRVLLTLSFLKRRFPDDQAALLTLNLSSEEMRTVLYGADEEEDRSRFRLWPW